MNKVQQQNRCSQESPANDLFKNQAQYIFKWPKIIKPKIDQVKNTLEYSLEKKEYKSNMQLDKKEDPKIIIQD